MKELWTLFWTFFKIGSMTFGGGYSMLPLLQKEIVEKYHWATEEELLDFFAVAQCTPGVIAVNTATFIGYRKKKSLGGVCATVGVITPSLIIIMIIASVLQQFASVEWVSHAFAGIRIAVVALIISAIVKLWKTGVKDAIGVCLFLVSFVLVAFVKISSVWIVILSILTGITVQLWKERNKIKEEK